MQKKQKWSPYAELGVAADASEAQVKTAYKKMALKWHPDKHPEGEREHATEQFKKVSEAYSILSNEKRRQYFDRHGSMEGEDDAINMDDVFAQMFAGMGANFGFVFDFEDMFEDLAAGLKGSKESKAFSKMFKDLEKSAKRASKPKGRAGRATANKKAKGKALGKDMDDMMMAMVMGDMMGDLMGFGGVAGAGKGKAKGKKSSAKDPFGGMVAAFAGMMEGDDSYEDELPDDLFEGDEYDSDEVEMIGKQMGLAKSEIKILKRDMKKKYEQANAHKKQPPKKEEPEAAGKEPA